MTNSLDRIKVYLAISVMFNIWCLWNSHDFMVEDKVLLQRKKAVGFVSQETALVALESILLNPVNNDLHPVYTSGCCGIGHRLSRVVPTLAYANKQKRKLCISFDDIPWNVIFHDNDYAAHCLRDDGWHRAKNEQLLFPNSIPNFEKKRLHETGTALDRYAFRQFYFHDPMILSVLKSMRDWFTPLTLSYLDPIYTQLQTAKRDNSLSMCIHVREGNDENGSWQKIPSRHVEDLESLLKDTLDAAQNFVRSRNAVKAHIFVASDNDRVWPWFDEHIPKKWTMVRPGKVMQKPERGTWISDEKTHKILNQAVANEAMAEAIADMFALAECDALFIPTYSSFTYVAIALTRANDGDVFFSKRSENGQFEFHEMRSLDRNLKP